MHNSQWLLVQQANQAKPPPAVEVNTADPGPLSKTVSHVTCVPPARTLATLALSYSAITPAEVAVLSDNPLSLGPTLTMCRYKEAMENRDFKFHLRHLEALRARVGLSEDQPEPKYSLLKEVKDRIADLTHLIACEYTLAFMISCLRTETQLSSMEFNLLSRVRLV